MSAHPIMVLKSGDLGVWVLEAGFNPPAIVRTLADGRQVGARPVSLGGIIAQLDLREWEEIEDLDQFFQPNDRDRNNDASSDGRMRPTADDDPSRN